MMLNFQSIDLLSLSSVSLDEKRKLPPISCIYFAIDENGNVQYIGRTTNLQQRWASHHKYSELSKIGNIRISYILMDEDLLDESERALIQWFHPPLNQKTNWLHGQPKRARQFALTDKAARMLQEMSKVHKVSSSEFLERIIRAVGSADKKWISEFLEKGLDDVE